MGSRQVRVFRSGFPAEEVLVVRHGLFGEGFWSGREESWGCKRKRSFSEWICDELRGGCREDMDRGEAMKERNIDEMTFFFSPSLCCFFGPYPTKYSKQLCRRNKVLCCFGVFEYNCVLFSLVETHRVVQLTFQ